MVHFVTSPFAVLSFTSVEESDEVDSAVARRRDHRLAGDGSRDSGRGRVLEAGFAAPQDSPDLSGEPGKSQSPSPAQHHDPRPELHADDPGRDWEPSRDHG